MKPDRDAIIVITMRPGVQIRPALFVFPLPDGFAWVEPSYLDPVPAPRPAVHRVRGVTSLGDGQFQVIDAQGWTYIAAGIAGIEPGTAQGEREAIAWAHAQIRDQGSTVDEERERVRAMLEASSWEA